MNNLAGGGAERTIVNILNTIDKEKFNLVLVLGSEQNNDYLNQVYKEIKIIILKANRNRERISKLAAVIKKENPDLLFTTREKNNIVLILSRILSLRKIPVIVRESTHRTKSGNNSIIFKLITFVLYNFFACKIIALSYGVKDDLLMNFGIRKRKIEVIYNPVDIENIEIQSNEIIDDVEIDNNYKTIVTIGRLAKPKDYPTLLKSVRLVKDKMDVKVIILGKGPEKENIVELISQLRIEDSVELVGFKDNPYKYLRKADLFLLTSRWEGFAHVIVEAMVLGIPVIATDCKSGPKEIIGENEYGVIVPVGDVENISENIIHILRDENLSDKYSDLGKKRARDFDSKKIIKQYEDLFLMCLNSER